MFNCTVLAEVEALTTASRPTVTRIISPRGRIVTGVTETAARTFIFPHSSCYSMVGYSSVRAAFITSEVLQTIDSLTCEGTLGLTLRTFESLTAPQVVQQTSFAEDVLTRRDDFQYWVSSSNYVAVFTAVTASIRCHGVICR
jgi:hypothetical protein